MSVSSEDIEITSQLQTACYDSYNSVINTLQEDVSEVDIANKIRAEMATRGITDYWYDVPIFVLFGTKRFLDIASEDYPTKSPHVNVFLQEGDPIYIDIHPWDTKTQQWGDWNSMLVFHPRKGIDDEQVAFLEEVQSIQRKGITQLQSMMTAADVAEYYFNMFENHGITLSDVRNNVGHSMHSGPKLPEKRLFLEKGQNIELGEGIYAIEPGGFRQKKSGEGIVVGRFEDCVYIPKKGKPVILGKEKPLPLVV